MSNKPQELDQDIWHDVVSAQDQSLSPVLHRGGCGFNPFTNDDINFWCALFTRTEDISHLLEFWCCLVQVIRWYITILFLRLSPFAFGCGRSREPLDSLLLVKQIYPQFRGEILCLEFYLFFGIRHRDVLKTKRKDNRVHLTSPVHPNTTGNTEAKKVHEGMHKKSQSSDQR